LGFGLGLELGFFGFLGLDLGLVLGFYGSLGMDSNPDPKKLSTKP
jgi:hypothetical protein